MISLRNVATPIVALVVLAGCETIETVARLEDWCEPSTERAEFVIACAKAGNPMSDEEGEDLVRQCQWTSEKLFCAKRWVSATACIGCSHLTNVVPCDLTKDELRIRLCREAGWEPKK